MFHLDFILLRIQRLLANSIDPDETAHDELPHLDLYCFANSSIFFFSALKAKSTEIK